MTMAGKDDPGLTRRTTLLGLAAVGTISTAGWARGARPVVETTYGRISGRMDRGVRIFAGVPYAASTAGINRFCPPQPVEPWKGIREATAFGNSAPQPAIDFPERRALAAIEQVSEECLTLNIFAPSRSSAKRRPIMVWLHGGAWRVGAASAPGLYGTELARSGDVVLVTINHRLDLLGFLKIDDGDPRFADSGNLGVLDMIAALKWVKANADAFGGDPDNVTIFGQSGGGSKVSALLGAPAAKGLFQKAIAQSCSGCLRITGAQEADMLAEQVKTRLALPKLTGDALQTLPLQQLIAASTGRHRPIVDGRTFATHPFDPTAPAMAEGIPLLIGNVASETRISLAAASIDNFDLDRAEVSRRLQRFLRLDPSSTDDILRSYEQAFPRDRPGDLLADVTTDYCYIRNTRRMADLQASHAPVYTYLFTRQTPVMGGILRSPHESEVPFIFGTTEAAADMVGRSADIPRMTSIMIESWSHFAWHGTPESRFLPSWARHTEGSNFGMMLDIHGGMGVLPGSDARASLDRLPIYEYNMPLNYTRA